MKIYVSGPITGMPNNNREAFAECANALREKGHNVINPCELDGPEADDTWENYLKRDLKILLDCEAIMLIDGWHRSSGAVLEFQVASRVGIKFFFWDNYLAGMYKDHPQLGEK